MKLILSWVRPKICQKKGTVLVDNALHNTLQVQMKDAHELWRGEYGEHVLELELEKDTDVYAFTFGSK